MPEQRIVLAILAGCDDVDAGAALGRVELLEEDGALLRYEARVDGVVGADDRGCDVGQDLRGFGTYAWIKLEKGSLTSRGIGRKSLSGSALTSPAAS